MFGQKNRDASIPVVVPIIMVPDASGATDIRPRDDSSGIRSSP
jgi:hypothetical protein